MLIHFSPVRCDDELTVLVAGDTVIVSGTPFDFTQLPEGGELPREALDSPWFCGPVRRQAGELRMTLRLPNGVLPSVARAFPEPMPILADGPVELPQ